MIHFPIRTESAPNEADVYIALCGYESGNRKEFVSVINPGMEKVTCEKCKESLSNHDL